MKDGKCASVTQLLAAHSAIAAAFVEAWAHAHEETSANAHSVYCITSTASVTENPTDPGMYIDMQSTALATSDGSRHAEYA